MTEATRSRPRYSASRRQTLKALAACAGSVLVGRQAAGAGPALDTTRIRLCRDAGLCVAPQYLAEALLHAEGFTEVEYVPETSEVGTSKLVASGAADINLSFALSTLVRVDAGEPIVLLAGVHVGCYELFGTPAVRTVRELKGRRIAVLGAGSTHQRCGSIGLRLQEVGMIKTTPQKLIAQGTDWRFLNELKRELKA